MTQRFNTEEMLKTRQFIEFDQINARQKIKSFKEEPKHLWQKLMNRSRMWIHKTTEKII